MASRAQPILTPNGQSEAERTAAVGAQSEFWLREPPTPPVDAVGRSIRLIERVHAEYQPTHVVAMVSGGRDSAAAYEIADAMGLKVDLILHGRTGTGIPETTQFVTDCYGSKGPDFAIADAGDAYERYVMRKGFFGVGRDAHNFSYRILKADPFRAAISRLICQRKRGVRVMLLNGARKSESENRRLNLKPTRLDKGNLWVNICHDWTAGDRDRLLAAHDVAINPVAVQLCRSGECMCGTMQGLAIRAEAAVIYPHWGGWLNDLERAVRKKHGFGWAEPYPKPRDPLQGDLFQPMCAGCERDILQLDAAPSDRASEAEPTNGDSGLSSENGGLK